jgi:hypothetical protein
MVRNPLASGDPRCSAMSVDSRLADSPGETQALETRTIDPDGFEFFRADDGSISRKKLYVLGTLRSFIDTLPATRATFTLAETDIASPFAQAVPVYTAADTWPVPDHYDSSDGAARKFVNPNYVHRHTYSDALVRCACGALIDERLSSSQASHDDSCTYLDTLRSSVALWERRERIIRESLAMWRRHDYLRKRLDANKSAVKYYADQLGIRRRDRSDAARLALGRFAADAHEFYSYTKLGELFGIDDSTVSKAVREFEGAADG